LSSKNTGVLTIDAGGIVNNSVNSLTILSSLNLSNAQTWNASSRNLAIQGAMNLGANTLTFGGPRGVAVGGVIQGSRSVTRRNAGALTMGGIEANSFYVGTINATKDNELGSGPLTISGGKRNIAGFNQTVETVSLVEGSVSGTSGRLSGMSYQMQSGIEGARLGGTGAFIKSGGGGATLTGANSFNGGTVINGETLAVNDQNGSGTGTGNVTINGGVAHLGVGSITGAIAIQTGNSISAGSGVGRLTTGAEFWLGGSTCQWEISDTASAAGFGWDLLKVNGALSISARSSETAFIDVVSFTLGGVPVAAGSFDPTQNHVWTIVQTSGGISFVPGQSALTVFELMTGSFANPLSGSSFNIGTRTTARIRLRSIPYPSRIGGCSWSWASAAIFMAANGRDDKVVDGVQWRRT
jgi:autotransporter-associated beta strand protein